MSVTYHDQFDQGSEQRRTIAEFPSYAVSSLGNVKRIVSGHSSPAGKVLKQNTIHGYRYVGLSSGGRVYSRRVNRLVCIAFYGNPPSVEHHAAHGDNDRTNNAVSNLRWATASENMLDKRAHGTMPTAERNGSFTKPDRRPIGTRNGKHTKPEATPRGERHSASRLNDDQVRLIRVDSRSRRLIAAAYGVSKCAIDGIKTGKTWSHVV